MVRIGYKIYIILAFDLAFILDLPLLLEFIKWKTVL